MAEKLASKESTVSVDAAGPEAAGEPEAPADADGLGDPVLLHAAKTIAPTAIMASTVGRVFIKESLSNIATATG
jgi:hypothetical protein